MFAYCGNNPIIRVDDSGQYYTRGQIHDFVIDDICDKDSRKRGSRAENKIIYSKPVFFSTYGYCDLQDITTNEIWELKRFGIAPSCQFAYAYSQLSNYVDGHLEKKPTQKLKFGGTQTMIESNVFTKLDNDGKGTYVIGYWDTGVGVLFYDYTYIPSGDELVVGIAMVAMGALAGWALGTAGAGAGAGALIAAA